MRTCTWALTCSLILLGNVTLAVAQPQPQQPQPQQPQPQYPPGYPPQQPQPQYPPPGYPPQQPQPQYPQPGYPPQQPQPQYPPPGYPPQQPPPNYPPPPQYPPPGYGSYYGPPNYNLPPEPPVRIRRNGLTLGLAVGGGSVYFAEESHMGLALQFGIGGMLSRQVGLLFDYSTVSRQVDSFASESHDIFGGVVQFFLTDFLWVKGGIGLGRLALSDGWGAVLDRTERSLAGIAGAGVDVVQTRGGFALDLQLRFVGSSYDDVGFTSNTSVLVGFNFY